MDRWSGKVAVVTGASSGIGAAVSVALVKSGLKVVGLARRVEKVEELQKELKDASGTLYPLKGDVSREEDINETFKWVKENLGTVHVLVNNAGCARAGKLTDSDPKNWKTVLDVNVIGLCICTQQAFKLMKETGVEDGHIIHINSLSGHRVPNLPNPSFNVYSASKHAVTALTETLRQELRFLKSKTKVTSISPGYVATEFVSSFTSSAKKEQGMEAVQALTQFTPLQSQDIADAVVYVLSTPPHVQVHELMIRPLEQPL